MGCSYVYDRKWFRTPFSYVNIIDDFKMLQVSLSDAKYIIENASYPDFKKIIVKASTIIDENKKI